MWDIIWSVLFVSQSDLCNM